MEEKKRKGRPRKSLLEVAAELPAFDPNELYDAFDNENRKQAQEQINVTAAPRYRSSPEDLEKVKAERLQRMKKFINHGADAKETTEENAGKVDFSPEEKTEIKQAFLGNYASLGECNRDFEKLAYSQIEVLGRVVRTDELLDEMLVALEDAGANQRWLTAAKSSFHCGMMETTRAILKPKGF